MNNLLTEDPELNCLFIKFIERCHMLINIHDINDLDKVNENTDDIQSCDCKYIQDYAFKYCNDQQSKKYDITKDDYKTQYHKDALKRMSLDNVYHIRLHDLYPECESSSITDKRQIDINDRTSDT